MLNFGAVDYEATVRVNGSVVGSHKGGFDAFGFDITPYLKAGENELIVEVLDPTSAGTQPRGKQILDPAGIWYTAVSRSEEHTSELQSLMRISYAVFCLNKKNIHTKKIIEH